MTPEQDILKTGRLPKLDRVLETLRKNPNIVFYTIEEAVIPPERGTAQFVTIYVAPSTPTIDPEKLNKLASRLTDLKITQRTRAYTSGETEEKKIIRYASFALVEDIGEKTSTTTTTFRFFDKALQDQTNPTQTDQRIHTLRRKIEVIVLPHQKVAEYLYNHAEELQDQGKPEQRRLLYEIHVKDVVSLINGQIPSSL